jgi:hypothetical protein
MLACVHTLHLLASQSVNRSAPRPLLSAAHAAIELGVPMQNGAAGVLVWGHLDTNNSAASPNSRTSYNRSVYKSLRHDFLAEGSPCCFGWLRLVGRGSTRRTLGTAVRLQRVRSFVCMLV